MFENDPGHFLRMSVSQSGPIDECLDLENVFFREVDVERVVDILGKIEGYHTPLSFRGLRETARNGGGVRRGGYGGGYGYRGLRWGFEFGCE